LDSNTQQQGPARFELKLILKPEVKQPVVKPLEMKPGSEVKKS
jgi:hypothetical protein